MHYTQAEMLTVLDLETPRAYITDRHS